MRFLRLILSVLILALGATTTARAQGAYKIEATREAPPKALSPSVRETLPTEAFRIVDGQGKIFAELWLCKGVPATEKPGGAKGAIRFPFLRDGELIGTLRFVSEGHDYRDQTIAPGVYTMRYGLQPVNSDHRGVSPHRDHVLLLPAALDRETARVSRTLLLEQSAESAGATHPAVFVLLAPASSVPLGPSMVHDEKKETWAAVVPLNIEVKGDAKPTPVNIQMIVVGAAPA